MTINEAIARCDALNPNTLTRTDKVNWLSQLDGLIKSEILDNYVRNDTETDITVFNGYDDNTSGDTELLVAFPYDDIYVNYLVAQVYLTFAENSKYNNYAALYDSGRVLFENYYSRTHKPKAPHTFTYF